MSVNTLISEQTILPQDQLKQPAKQTRKPAQKKTATKRTITEHPTPTIKVQSFEQFLIR